MGQLYPALARLLFAVADAERAHHLAICALESGLVPTPPGYRPDPRLQTEAFGLAFPTPIGLAAGFDKDAKAPDAMLHAGFGFVEVGTLTPNAQPGNERPRMFRLREDGAVINRLGFNNGGHGPALRRLTARANRPGVVGVNVGANKDATDRVADYVAGVQTFADVASYFTINVSSPNTPGLRDLQAREALHELLTAVLDARDAATVASGRTVPLLLKLAPDLDRGELEDAVAVATECGVDGLVISNTTVARPDSLSSPAASELGGLSGSPLMRTSTTLLARVHELTGGAVPLVAVGGVASGDDVFEKLRAGATLVQLYTAMIYRGPWIGAHVARELAARLDAEGITDLAEVRGSGAAEWAAQDL